MLIQTLTVELNCPHAAQAEIKASRKRFNVLSCGRRFGKTDLFVGLIAETALGGFPVGYFAPTYKLVIETWDALCRALAEVITSKNFTEKRIELITGGVIEIWTMDDPDAGRSRKYKRVVIDEGGLQKNLLTIWRNAIRPTLMDYEGDAFIGGTPKGLNDFQKMFSRAGIDPDWAAFQYPTMANPFIPPAEIEAYKKEMGGEDSAEYRQEILAEFVEGAASYFGDLSHVYTAPTDAPYVTSHYYVAGIDWGQQNDYTVMVVIDATERRMVAMLRIRHELWSSMRAECVALLSKYKVSLCMPEANAMGSSQIEELRNEVYAAGLRTAVNAFTMSATSKPALMQTLRMALTEGTLTLQPIDVLKHEMNAAQAVQKNGIWTIDSPRDEHGHGDTVVALGLAWRAAGFVVR